MTSDYTLQLDSLCRKCCHIDKEQLPITVRVATNVSSSVVDLTMHRYSPAW